MQWRTSVRNRTVSGSICQPGALVAVAESTLKSDLCAGNSSSGGQFAAGQFRQPERASGGSTLSLGDRKSCFLMHAPKLLRNVWQCGYHLSPCSLWQFLLLWRAEESFAPKSSQAIQFSSGCIHHSRWPSLIFQYRPTVASDSPTVFSSPKSKLQMLTWRQDLACSSFC